MKEGGTRAESGVVISPQFCSSEPVDLTFTTKGERLVVVDTNNNVIWTVKSRSPFLGDESLMLVDAATGLPLVRFKQKSWSFREQWQVFLGDSLDPKDLVFTVKRSSMFQFKTELNVFLASNKANVECDFKIKGSYRKKSCTIYKGESSMVGAQMTKDHKADVGTEMACGCCWEIKKKAFGVAINGNTDSSFVAVLIIILHELHKASTHQSEMDNGSAMDQGSACGAGTM